MSGTVIDISPTVTGALAVWPGDTPPEREVLMDMKRGDNLTLSTLRSTVHLGAHCDAPSHYVAAGQAIAELPLAPYIGDCQVITCRARGELERGKRVELADLDQTPESERILIRTDTFPDPYKFNEDFAGLSPDLIDFLGKAGTLLVGIDTPSVDLFSSKDLPAHEACARNGVLILEGIVLRDVNPGRYELIALPLKLDGFDASPVRAVLR